MTAHSSFRRCGTPVRLRDHEIRKNAVRGRPRRSDILRPHRAKSTFERPQQGLPDGRVVAGLDAIADVAFRKRACCRQDGVEITKSTDDSGEHGDQLAPLLGHVSLEQRSDLRRCLEQPVVKHRGCLIGDRGNLREARLNECDLIRRHRDSSILSCNRSPYAASTKRWSLSAFEGLRSEPRINKKTAALDLWPRDSGAAVGPSLDSGAVETDGLDDCSYKPRANSWRVRNACKFSMLIDMHAIEAGLDAIHCCNLWR
jgi:hypothetical protein